jgi:phenylpropionate dioxygenase-like ring-hydroxylating dioxygenase large terminal subunit
LAPLSLGRCEGEDIRCMYHGLLYDRAGSVRDIPGQDFIPLQARVRVYPIVERHSWIWIRMGTGVADAALIPPAVGLQHPDYLLGGGQPDYAAEARLINDNLLDFSHLSFVHASSFGASETWARSRPAVQGLERGVRFERWICGEKGTPGRTFDVPVDRYSRYDFLLPGILLMTGGVFPQGTAQRLEGRAPDLEEAMTEVTFTSQAVTPMTAKTSRYFFSWGPHRRFGDIKVRDSRSNALST